MASNDLQSTELTPAIDATAYSRILQMLFTHIDEILRLDRAQDGRRESSTDVTWSFGASLSLVVDVLQLGGH